MAGDVGKCIGLKEAIMGVEEMGSVRAGELGIRKFAIVLLGGNI